MIGGIADGGAAADDLTAIVHCAGKAFGTAEGEIHDPPRLCPRKPVSTGITSGMGIADDLAAVVQRERITVAASEGEVHHPLRLCPRKPMLRKARRQGRVTDTVGGIAEADDLAVFVDRRWGTVAPPKSAEVHHDGCCCCSGAAPESAQARDRQDQQPHGSSEAHFLHLLPRSTRRGSRATPPRIAEVPGAVKDRLSSLACVGEAPASEQLTLRRRRERAQRVVVCREPGAVPARRCSWLGDGS